MGSLLPDLAHIGEVVSVVVDPCWALSAWRLAMLMDRLDRRGNIFLEWASAAFGEGERCGSGELPEINSSSACRSTLSGVTTSLPLLGRAGGNGRGGSRDNPVRPASNWVRKRSFSSRSWFACSRSSATCLACFSCLASSSWRQRRN